MSPWIRALLVAAVVSIAPAAAAQTAAVYRYPDVSRSEIVFLAADDLWVVAREGGEARRLTAMRGAELFPRFSPDGGRVAFSSAGSVGLLLASDDLYTIPAAGGEPARVTHHPGAEILADWTAAGRLLFFSNGATANFRQHELFTVAPAGGLPERIGVPYGAFASLSDDGEWLAYVLHYPDIGITWKRYRGGLAPDVWLFNLRTRASKRITDWAGTDTLPMWHGRTVYYLSDAAGRLNVWAYDTTTGRRRQVTAMKDHDVKWPSIGPGTGGRGEIVFQCGADLYLVDLATDAVRRVDVRMPASAWPAPREVDASRFVDGQTWSLSPAGDHVAVQARGDVWALPVGGGAPRALTRTDGVAERGAAWSPDGRWIAFFSDASGEYELTIAPAGGGEPVRLTSLGPGFRSPPMWSPDSKRLAFTDQTGAILVHTIETRETRVVDRETLGASPRPSWSHDSSWLAYTKMGPGMMSAVWLYDVAAGAARQVTSGRFDDRVPVFDRTGDTLYYASTRDFSSFTFGMPRLGDIDQSFVHAETEVLLAVPLRRDGRARGARVEIDLDGFEARGRVLPLPQRGGRWSFFSVGIDAGNRPVYYFTRLGQQPSLRVFDPASGKERTVAENVNGFDLSDDGRSLLVIRGGDALSVVDLTTEGAEPRAVSTSGMTVRIDPRVEWRQLFVDGWRMFRDFFYDPAMHGVDWGAERARYEPLVERATSRDDVNYLLGEMAAELDASHAWASGGDQERTTEIVRGQYRIYFQPRRGVGMLGVDFELAGGAYRIARVYRGAAWDADARNPLDEAGVREGDYLVAVEGTPVDVTRDPWAAFVGLAGKTISLTVTDRPGGATRTVKVTALESERDLRYRDWVERTRAYVERRSNGRIGYVYVPFTAYPGQVEFFRQFWGQLGTEALIVDDRWNGGGEGTAFMLEALARRPEEFSYLRGSDVRPEPHRVHRGPKILLVNAMAGSGGDALAYNFRRLGIGRLVGTTTWGGIIGNSGNPSLVDDGAVGVPARAMFGADGQWVIEGEGVRPDIEVVDDPAKMVDGRDPQLDAAIDALLQEIGPLPRRPVAPPPPRIRRSHG